MLHLGSELISSDGIAFYELIKNALDARSTEIEVDILQRLPFETYDEIIRELGEDRETPVRIRERYIRELGDERRGWHELKQYAIANLAEGTPKLDTFREKLERTRSRAGFLEGLRHANCIEIDDDGHGMSLDMLEHVYLTIGTRYRADERDEQSDADDQVILGEKGIGRLSAMRLGDILEVITGEDGEDHWNQLEVDWNDFADAQEDDLSSVEIEAGKGAEKNEDEHGTRLRIYGLKSDWSVEKLRDLAVKQFSKLTDPLNDDSRLPLSLTFNGEPVEIPRFAEFLLEQAHGHFTASLVIDDDGDVGVEGLMEYRLHDRQRTFSLSALEIATMTGADIETIRRVGPFDVEIYWFNRRILTKIEGIGSLKVIREILKEWAGGVAVYRDGYRVNPYGSADDDWLDLDRDAFSTSGFKLNRGQIIGGANITSRGNPFLIDQTNREGLKDNSEQRAFRDILAGMTEMYRLYLVEIDRDIADARRETATTALERFQDKDERLMELIPMLEDVLGDLPEARELKKQFVERIEELRTAADIMQQVGRSQAEERGRVFHLASIGLMIESLAHELYRATSAGLATIADARRSDDERSTQSSLRVLGSQLRTLQKRLKVLDPLSTNARQTKEFFGLVSWVDEIVAGYARRNQSSRIEFKTTVLPKDGELTVKAVKGMFVQVIENLLANSVFWIDAQYKIDRKAGIVKDDADEPIGKISVEIDLRTNRITVTDTGPGIPEERRDLVFEPFFSTKKQKQGKGLGLHISREIAEYHGGQLTLGSANEDGTIRSVIFEFGDIAVDDE